jgi:hypothetical protein
VSVYYVLAPDLGLVKIGFAAEPKALQCELSKMICEIEELRAA